MAPVILKVALFNVCVEINKKIEWEMLLRNKFRFVTSILMGFLSPVLKKVSSKLKNNTVHLVITEVLKQVIDATGENREMFTLLI